MSDSDISLALGHHDVVHQMLATSSWGTRMSDERSDSTLSLVQVHTFERLSRC